MFLELGFRLAFLYGALGLSLEALHRHLPAEVYLSSSQALWALPAWLVETAGLSGALSSLLHHGQVPNWIVGSVLPLLGVLSILFLSFALGLMWSFGGLIGSLKDR